MATVVNSKKKKLITEQEVAGWITDLRQLPAKALTLQQSIEKASPALLEAMDKGYTLEDLCGFLAQRGIVITPGTLSRYLKRSGQPTEPKPESKLEPKPEPLAPATEPVEISAGVEVEQPSEGVPVAEILESPEQKGTEAQFSAGSEQNESAQPGPGAIATEQGRENQKEPESTVSVGTEHPKGTEPKPQQKVAPGQKLARVLPNGTIVGKESNPA